MLLGHLLGPSVPGQAGMGRLLLLTTTLLLLNISKAQPNKCFLGSGLVFTAEKLKDSLKKLFLARIPWGQTVSLGRSEGSQGTVSGFSWAAPQKFPQVSLQPLENSLNAVLGKPLAVPWGAFRPTLPNILQKWGVQFQNNSCRFLAI